jgi:plasmid maintenance system antidote protein VapI
MTATADASRSVMQPQQARTLCAAEGARRDVAMTGVAPGYRQRRARAIAQGTWQPLAADPEPVREHARQLRTTGASYQAIGQAAGVSATAVHALINGTGRVTAHTADALMGLTPSQLNPGRVPALGTARRIRALVAMGHSQTRISQALDCHPDTVNHLARGTVATVRADLQADTEQLYGAWWDKRPPERTAHERTAAEAARRRAQRAGWCTGAGLDDARISDPSYVPQASWRRAEGTGPALEDPLGRHRDGGPATVRASRHREPAPELEPGG